jgi:hypothetical protein
MPEYTAEVVAVGTLRLLDAIKTCGLEKSVKFYQASTSELFGKVQEVPQTEKTPFYPRLVKNLMHIINDGGGNLNKIEKFMKNTKGQLISE